MERVLITGGAGFIGSHLSEKLLKEEIAVVCIDNFSNYYNPEIKKRNIKNIETKENFSLVQCDIRNLSDMKDKLTNQVFDKLIHLAALPGVIPSVQDPVSTFSNNVVGTQNMLEICRELDIQHVIFGSSSSVYGNREKGPFSESLCAAEPESPYAASKRMGELLCHSYNKMYGMDATCLRFFTVYGPRQRPDMAIHHFVNLAYTTDSFPVYGSPETARDYTYIGDIVEGIIAALKICSGFDIINLGAGVPVKLGDLIATICKATNTDPIIEWKPKRVGDVPLTHSDIMKAKSLLNYSPKIALADGVSHFVKWYKKVHGLF